MTKPISTLLVALGGLLLSISPAVASTNHAALIKGPIDSGPAATKQCLRCHDDAAAEVMGTSHWTWSALQGIRGKSVDRGKKNTINNFCVSTAANEPRCTSCHIGYGWKDAGFDFTDKTAVDCLVCHDTTGTYKKEPTGAGAPAKGIDLLRVAQNVGNPTRANCGACHFFGGGGDAVKHGDLDSSMEYPERSVDVHMSPDGNDFQCQNCHETSSHKIMGRAMVVSPGGTDHIGCDKCHGADPHKESRLNTHAGSLACQSCHIPHFAKEIPTKLSWDWSTAGRDIDPTPIDKLGKATYSKKKGDFSWGKKVVPTYRWYNGTAGAYLTGDTMDPSKVTPLAYPNGDKQDKAAKIYPFKTHSGKQIYDTKNNIFITPKLFGKEGYWKTLDWDKSARLGMEASGLPYSGSYGFAPSIMYWRINHMVSPKEQALSCLDCHGDSKRMNWKELGYEGDPMNNPEWGRSL
ncbi:MAG: cytochrome C [Desulfuromonas sp.]|uniref:tetrathionate reductase family octaheme c-type cytochrome n=1 Tax=Desulfuromonas sp. TaxID=892 RepID=UPI000CBB29C4|nr:tetrathionate reductase family octaheme c-type cytochrome [Desulfuromonas sp.]PLX85662.1 MAG: cytochrome C [Desulfuromonas sp.]